VSRRWSSPPAGSAAPQRPHCPDRTTLTARLFCPSRTAVPDSPGRRGLAGELDGPRLADHGDPDLAWVGQLLLDLLGHVAGDHLCLDVVDIFRLDHHPDLPAGLHCEHLLDAAL